MSRWDPKEHKSSVLSTLEEAAIVSLRVQAPLPLDEVYVVLKVISRIQLRQAAQGITLQNAFRSDPADQ